MELFKTESRQEKLFMFFAVAVILFFASMASPFYAYDSQVDINVWVTIGRAMHEGIMPYRDLLDHKGPLLYLLYYFLTAVGSSGYLGVYLIEVIAGCLFVYYGKKFFELFDCKNAAVWSVFAYLLFALAKCFNFGGTVEELLVPGYFYAFYIVIRMIKEQQAITGTEGFVAGLWVAAAFWVKFNLALYPVSVLLIGLGYMVRKKYFHELIRALGAFIFSVYFVTCLSFGFVWTEGIWDEMLWVYFWFNLNVYNPALTPAIYAKSFVMHLVYLLRAAPIYFVLGLLGIGWFYRKREKDIALVLVCSFFAYFLLMAFTPAAYVYYHIMFAPAVFLGMLNFMGVIRTEGFTEKSVMFCLGMILVVVSSFSLTTCRPFYLGSSNSRDKIVGMLKENPESSFLVYFSPDLGLYNQTGKLPVTRSFSQLGCTAKFYLQMYYSDMLKSIMNEKPEFIVSLKESPELEPYGYKKHFSGYIDSAVSVTGLCPVYVYKKG